MKLKLHFYFSLVISVFASYCPVYSAVQDSRGEPQELRDLSFGRAQVELFLNDRPDVKLVISNRPDIKAWLSESFAGIDLGMRIHWDDRTPQGMSQVITAALEHPHCIRVTNSSSIEAMDRIALLAFELCNVRRTNAMVNFSQNARSRNIDETEFVRGIFLQEHIAMLECKKVLARFKVPSTTPYAARILTCPENFEEFFKGLDSNFYRQYYRDNILPSRISR